MRQGEAFVALLLLHACVALRRLQLVHVYLQLLRMTEQEQQHPCAFLPLTLFFSSSSSLCL